MTNRATTPRLNLRHVATLLSGLPGVAAGWGLWAATGSSSFQGEPGNYSLLWQFPPVLFGVAISTALAVLSALLVFRDRPQQPHSLGSIVIHHFRSPCSLLYLWALPLFALLPAVALVPLAAGGLRRLGWVTIPLTLYPIVRAALPRQASGAVARLHRNWSAAFGIVIVIFLAGWARISSNLLDRLQPTGDEPHYLRQIESLLQDFDLDLANNVPGYCPAWPPD